MGLDSEKNRLIHALREAERSGALGRGIPGRDTAGGSAAGKAGIREAIERFRDSFVPGCNEAFAGEVRRELEEFRGKMAGLIEEKAGDFIRSGGPAGTEKRILLAMAVLDVACGSGERDLTDERHLFCLAKIVLPKAGEFIARDCWEAGEGELEERHVGLRELILPALGLPDYGGDADSFIANRLVSLEPLRLRMAYEGEVRRLLDAPLESLREEGYLLRERIANDTGLPLEVRSELGSALRGTLLMRGVRPIPLERKPREDDGTEPIEEAEPALFVMGTGGSLESGVAMKLGFAESLRRMAPSPETLEEHGFFTGLFESRVEGLFIGMLERHSKNPDCRVLERLAESCYYIDSIREILPELERGGREAHYSLADGMLESARGILEPGHYESGRFIEERGAALEESVEAAYRFCGAERRLRPGKRMARMYASKVLVMGEFMRRNKISQNFVRHGKCDLPCKNEGTFKFPAGENGAMAEDEIPPSMYSKSEKVRNSPGFGAMEQEYRDEVAFYLGLARDAPEKDKPAALEADRKELDEFRKMAGAAFAEELTRLVKDTPDPDKPPADFDSRLEQLCAHHYISNYVAALGEAAIRKNEQGTSALVKGIVGWGGGQLGASFFGKSLDSVFSEYEQVEAKLAACSVLCKTPAPDLTVGILDAYDAVPKLLGMRYDEVHGTGEK